MRTVSVIIAATLFYLPQAERTALADQSFTHWDLQFRVTVPENFEVVQDPAPNVGVLLKHKEHGYPTFNVVVVPGLYKAGSLEPEFQSEQIQAEYGQVGINSPIISAAEKLKISGRNGFSVELSYELGGQNLKSSVIKTSGVSRHYILTFIDRTEDFEKSRPLQKELLASFNTWADKEMDVAEEPKQSRADLFITLLLAIAGLTALSFGIRYLRKR